VNYVKILNARRSRYYGGVKRPHPSIRSRRWLCFFLYWQNIQTSSISWYSLRYLILILSQPSFLRNVLQSSLT